MKKIRAISRRDFLAVAAGGGALLVTGHPARASAWRPTKNIRIVVPSTAGGISDLLARLVAEHLRGAWGATVIVDNKPGGGGTIGANDLLRSEPDGHTLLTTSPGPQAIAYTLFKNLTYNDKSFLPLSGLAQFANVLAVHPSVPAKNVPELIAYMKANPEVITYGGPIGSTLHLSGLWFGQLTNTKLLFVPYAGSSQTALALLGGQIQIMFDNLFSQMQSIRDDKLKGFGVTSREPSPFFPELPPLRTTAPELASFDVTSWIALATAARVPQEAAIAYNEELKVMLSKPETIARIKTIGGEPDYNTLEAARAYEQSEIAKWSAIISKAGLKIDN